MSTKYFDENEPEKPVPFWVKKDRNSGGVSVPVPDPVTASPEMELQPVEELPEHVVSASKFDVDKPDTVTIALSSSEDDTDDVEVGLIPELAPVDFDVTEPVSLEAAGDLPDEDVVDSDSSEQETQEPAVEEFEPETLTDEGVTPEDAPALEEEVVVSVDSSLALDTEAVAKNEELTANLDAEESAPTVFAEDEPEQLADTTLDEDESVVELEIEEIAEDYEPVAEEEPETEPTSSRVVQLPEMPDAERPHVAPEIVRPAAPPETDIVEYIQRVTTPLLHAISRKVVGQEELKQSLLISLLTNGHLLLESLPGLAKTTAAAALAKALDSEFKRIQCTPDLLPADIIGTQVYNNKTNEFTTQLGPVHANIVLLDEINRSSAKTQSAMLEAMQERQTSIGGVVYPLPEPFLVLATQNPIEQEGTYRLPEAQLDRFLMKETLTYPTPSEELAIIQKIEDGDLDENRTFTTDVTVAHILYSQQLVKQVYVSPKIKEYIVHIVSATRDPENVPAKYADGIEEGASPRATIAFLKASQAVAVLQGRDHVIPEDIKALAHRILRHRIKLNYSALADNITVEDTIDAILDSIKVA